MLRVWQKVDALHGKITLRESAPAVALASTRFQKDFLN